MKTIEIPLSQGMVALIDELGGELVRQYCWHVAKRDLTFYAGSMGLRPGCYYMHRLITNAKAGLHVDHRNSNGLDNRRSNIRICTNAENRRNTRKTRGVSRFKGVAYDSRQPGRPWTACINLDNRKQSLGSYPTEIEAARAYNAAALRLHKDFARLNEIEGLSYEKSIIPPIRNRKPGRPCRSECNRTAGPKTIVRSTGRTKTMV